MIRVFVSKQMNKSEKKKYYILYEIKAFVTRKNNERKCIFTPYLRTKMTH